MSSGPNKADAPRNLEEVITRLESAVVALGDDISAEDRAAIAKELAGLRRKVKDQTVGLEAVLMKEWTGSQFKKLTGLLFPRKAGRKKRGKIEVPARVLEELDRRCRKNEESPAVVAMQIAERDKHNFDGQTVKALAGSFLRAWNKSRRN